MKPVIIEELVARIRIHVSNAKAAFGARVALDATGAIFWRSTAAAGCSGARRRRPIFWRRASALSRFCDRSRPSVFSALLREAAERRDDDAPAAAGPVCVSFLCEIGGEELLFRLSEPQSVSNEAFLAQKFALTLREAEVLSWLARGESNHDIAESLHLAAHGA